MAKNNRFGKGLIAIGIGILLIISPQFFSLVTCGACPDCSGAWLDFDCLARYYQCIGASGACGTYAFVINQVPLVAGLAILLYGIYKIVS